MKGEISNRAQPGCQRVYFSSKIGHFYKKVFWDRLVRSGQPRGAALLAALCWRVFSAPEVAVCCPGTRSDQSVAAANKLARLCKVILIALKNDKCCTRCSTLIWLLSLRAAEHVVRCVLLVDLCTSSCCSFLSHTGWPRFLLNNSSEEFKNIFLPQETFWKRV